MKYIFIVFALSGCSRVYTVNPYYGDKELFGCAIERRGLGRDFLFLDKDIDKVNNFCQQLRDKK